jgi:hypothetical protein
MKGLIMNASQQLAQLVARNGGVNLKTIRYNDVEFKEGTARLHVTEDQRSVDIVAQQHAGHEILVKHLGRYVNPDERSYYTEQAFKILNMLNS